MSTVRKILVLCIGLMFALKSWAGIDPDSSKRAESIKGKIKYNKRYNFIKYNENHLEWKNYNAVAPLFDKMNKVSHRKLKVLHIGDSHIQFDLQTGTVRNGLQEIFGYGGRGFVSPFSAARTHATYDYLVSHRGIWQNARNTNYNPRLPLGPTGVTVKTFDPRASFKFRFLESKHIKKNFTKIKIYTKTGPECFDLKVKTGDSYVKVDLNKPTDKPYVEVDIPQGSTNLEVIVDKNNPAQKYFECYGVYIESDEDKGVVYSSVGVNGANLSSILKEDLLEEHIKGVNPDLIILDIGINDFYMNNTVDSMVKDRLVRVVNRLRKSAPNASIMLTNAQDTYHYKQNITACVKYAAITRQVAFDNNCVYYDYFAVSGNKYSMLKWLNYGLAKSDKIHLKNSGYRVKGELYLNAILNSYYTSMTETSLDNYIVKRAKPNVVIPSQPVAKAKPTYYKRVAYKKPVKKKVSIPNAKKQMHIVRYGQSLGYIANIYGVTISQIQAWNNIRGYYIYPNQKIFIYSNKVPKKATPKKVVKKKPVVKATPKPVVKKKSTSFVKNGKVYHKIVKGDTLWAIARKHGVTVEHIKHKNGLKSDKVKIGSIILVK